METLLQLRKSKGLTQKDVADALGISRQAYANYEAGNREPDLTTLKALSVFFGVSIDYLLNNQTEKPADEGELTEREATVINAYRNQPEMQIAVERLLGIFNDEYVQLYTAASSSDNRPDKIIKMPKEKWDKIKNAPDTDDNLI